MNAMSLRAFIIRPFGPKRDVNLDAFEATLSALRWSASPPPQTTIRPVSGTSVGLLSTMDRISLMQSVAKNSLGLVS